MYQSFSVEPLGLLQYYMFTVVQLFAVAGQVIFSHVTAAEFN
jgi:hypothetical protein